MADDFGIEGISGESNSLGTENFLGPVGGGMLARR